MLGFVLSLWHWPVSVVYSASVLVVKNLAYSFVWLVAEAPVSLLPYKWQHHIVQESTVFLADICLAMLFVPL